VLSQYVIQILVRRVYVAQFTHTHKKNNILAAVSENFTALYYISQISAVEWIRNRSSCRTANITDFQTIECNS
jgi:hypothetical protein